MSSLNVNKKVLFYRDFREFSGGHLKVRNYFDHINRMPGFQAQIYFSPESVWDANNPWHEMRDETLAQWQPERADYLFLAGLDWLRLDPAQRDAPPAPVINFIQHVRHADLTDPRYAFLGHPAMRICVSHEVEMAIRATGQVNGPIWTIPNGIDLDITSGAPASGRRGGAILIAGLKNPQLAGALALSLQAAGIAADLLLDALPREHFLARLAQTDVVLLLPHEREGFYLPALEAMALGCIVVCPDCVGNRSFCHDGINCYRPAYDEDALLSAALQACAMDPAARATLLGAAAQTARSHSLVQERAALHRLLKQIS